ncbi:hypothetical protein CEUSTIGMA_g11295.t1 [Chlamydomonas eustigma]|uniref:SPT2 chromatin protein n=1 Tax=Chlamydomonas eustigma TaxID=1157962 RepID=A0A250XM56_9CHLO|nr:hypothetical protein CEUSTIGMA_g11295.t1 [Chlamydomonas eustigma]|eukprot:GAX83870.1 hypothetical protein CEUSTIGMA_g11295.t1 [Chlamydomonas eustigma]
MVTGLFGGPLSTRAKCEDREAREQLLAEAKRQRLAAERRSIKKNETNKQEQPLHPVTSIKEQKKLQIRADLDTFDDLNNDSPKGAKRLSGKRPRAGVERGVHNLNHTGNVAKPGAKVLAAPRRGHGHQTNTPRTQASTKVMSPSKSLTGSTKPGSTSSQIKRPPTALNPSMTGLNPASHLPNQKTAPSSAAPQLGRSSASPSPNTFVQVQARTQPAARVPAQGAFSKPLQGGVPVPHGNQAAAGTSRFKNSSNSGLSLKNSSGVPKISGLPPSSWSGKPMKRLAPVKPPSVQNGSFYPQALQRKPGRYRDDDDLESEDESDEGFVVDDDDDIDGASEDWRKEMRKLTRYDPRKFQDKDEDDRNMVAGWREIEAEEKRSARLGRAEDEKEELLERKRKEEKMKQKKKRNTGGSAFLDA